ncbi:MAG: ribonuclease III domain-containing protein, partial [Alloprevotella sp.]|nr:ribonuclease III domain-containing protein [Alloprevotella sp.]
MINQLIDRVRFMFCKDKPLASALRNILGFYPRNLDVYRIALAHKSAKFRPRRGQRFERPLNNERLEYLGDAILEAVTSDILYHKYPRQGEGFLTSTRAKLVQRSMLNRLADEMGLDKLINKSLVASTHNVNIGGNAFEALVGAVYLDRGYRYCQWFVGHRIIGSLLDVDTVARKEINFKSKLLEWSQKNRIQMTYSDTQIDKPGSNSAEFVSIALLEGVKAGRGTGFSKKESQQNAAKEALINMRASQTFYESIFHAKEQRTAMEESEICVLPRIQEIEDAVQQRFAAQAKDGQRRRERNAKDADAKNAPAKTAAEPKKGEPKAADPKAADPKAAEPKREAKKGEAKTAEPKREAKKTETKSAEVKAAEPKAAEPKREAKEQQSKREAKKDEPKAAEVNAAEPKAAEPKREAKEQQPKREAKKAEPKREVKAQPEVKEAPAPSPVSEAPVQTEAPAEQEVPAEPTKPAKPAKVETPAQPEAVAPTEETAVEEAPVEAAPAEPAPVEETPAKASAPVEAVPAEEMPAKVAP